MGDRMVSIEEMTTLEEHIGMSAQRYTERMERELKTRLPTKTKGQLDAVHHNAVDGAIQHFKQNTGLMNDPNEGKLMERLDSLYREWEEKNEKASREKTVEVLNSLYLPITERVRKRTYRRDGGYGAYQQDLSRFQARFGQEKSGLGVKAEETYEEFMRKKFGDGRYILAYERRLRGRQSCCRYVFLKLARFLRSL